MSDPGPKDYVHGTHPEEQRRLADMNALINAHSLAALAPRPGERLLDLGSGLGQFARDVARFSGAAAIGVEFSAEQLARAGALAAAAGESALVTFRAGDAADPPLAADEWGAFDVAHARFLLEHVRDPLAVVKVMARAVRRGGRVVLEDDDHGAMRLWPEPAHFETVWRAYTRTYDRLGCDPIVGRRLVELLAHAGLRPRRTALLPFGAGAGEAAFVPLVRNLIDVLTGAREAILATSGADAPTFAAAMDALEAFGRRDDAVIWYTISWAEGVRA